MRCCCVWKVFTEQDPPSNTISYVIVWIWHRVTILMGTSPYPKNRILVYISCSQFQKIEEKYICRQITRLSFWRVRVFSFCKKSFARLFRYKMGRNEKKSYGLFALGTDRNREKFSGGKQLQIPMFMPWKRCWIFRTISAEIFIVMDKEWAGRRWKLHRGEDKVELSIS